MIELSFISSWQRVLPGLVAACTVITSASAFAGALTASPDTIGYGESTTMSLAVPLAAADSIAGFDLEMTYDPSLLSYVSGSFILGLPLDGWSPVVNESTPGDLSISIANLAGVDDPDTAGAAETLFSLTLRAAPGTAASTSVMLNVADYAVGLDGEFQIAPQSVVVTITAPADIGVPEPASFLLFAAAVPAMLTLSRRRRN